MAKAKFYQKTIVRYFLNGKRRTKDGQAVTKATPGARAKKEKSKTWRGTYQGADGQEHDVPLGDDEDLARQKFVELVKRARREAAGDIDPFEDHRKRPLVEHVEEFENGLLAKGVTEKQAGQALRRADSRSWWTCRRQPWRITCVSVARRGWGFSRATTTSRPSRAL